MNPAANIVSAPLQVRALSPTVRPCDEQTSAVGMKISCIANGIGRTYAKGVQPLTFLSVTAVARALNATSAPVCTAAAAQAAVYEVENKSKDLPIPVPLQERCVGGLHDDYCHMAEPSHAEPVREAVARVRAANRDLAGFARNVGLSSAGLGRYVLPPLVDEVEATGRIAVILREAHGVMGVIRRVLALIEDVMKRNAFDESDVNFYNVRFDIFIN